VIVDRSKYRQTGLDGSGDTAVYDQVRAVMKLVIDAPPPMTNTA
jgi:phage gp45-like